MYCSKCGTEATDPGARFCNNCGAPLTEEAKESTHQTYGLLNPSNTFYLLHEQMWDWGYGDIYNEKGSVIGRMKRIILSLRRDIELQNPDGTIVGKVRRKIIALRPIFDIFDAEGNMIGRTKQKLLSVFRPAIWLEDPEGNKLMKAQGNFMKWNFKITDEKKKLVAEIEKADKWRDVFLGGVFDFSDKYAIRIYGDIDRLTVLGFAIAVDDAYHDQD
ncbi:MAG: LURP-one-related family protein [Promethearchaeota archaeon]